MTKGMQKLSGGWSTWRWLSGANAKQRQWFLGIVKNRDGYAAWSTHMARGLQDETFLLAFERESDPWQRAKMVGEKISALRKSFLAMSDDQRAELAKQGETELRTGLELLGRDKKTIEDLIQVVDPPAQ